MNTKYESAIWREAVDELNNMKNMDMEEVYNYIQEFKARVKQEIGKLGKARLLSNPKKEEAVAPSSITDSDKSYSNVTVNRLQDELADNMDGFRKYMIDWAIQMVNVLDQDRQALLHKLTAENKKLKKEIEAQKPVVEVAKKENTRSMLEKKLNEFKLRRS
jgi:hypothetical protein